MAQSMLMSLTTSLVIPCYNEEQTLAACLDAVVAQSLQFDEVIIVDNNSNDATAQIAAGYSDRLNTRLLNEAHQGVAWASQSGYDAATGDVIARIDADSRLEPEWIERAVTHLEAHPEVDGVTGAAWLYDMPKLDGRAKAIAAAERFESAAAGPAWLLSGNNSVFRREAWVKVRGAVKNLPGTHEDIGFSCALGEAGCTMRVLPGMLVGLSPRRFAGPPRDIVAYIAAAGRTLAAYRQTKLLLRFVLGLPLNIIVHVVFGYYARKGQKGDVRSSPVTR